MTVNGRRYDMRSGKLLSGTVSKPVSKPAPAKKLGRIKYVDGLVAPKNSSTVKPKPVKAKKPKPAKKPALAQEVHSRQIKSKTLIRQAVKRPLTKPRIIKDNHRNYVRFISPAPAIAKLSTLNTPSASPERLARAAKTGLHKQISRFGIPNPSPKASASFPAVPVRTAPKPKEPIRLLPSTVTSARHGELKKLLSKSLAEADSHKQEPHPLPKRTARWRKIATPGLAGVVLVLGFGFFAYQNVPGAAMRLASTRSGINASLPTYKPSGFSFKGPIQFNDREVRVKYVSTSGDDRVIAISQSPSDWDSQALAASFLSSKPGGFQLIQDNGKAIYIYGDQQATWVDKGLWYRLEGNAGLSSQQIVSLANSF